MEELIFFAVIIFFSIVESIARSRKAKQGGGTQPEAEFPAPGPETRRSPQAEPIPTYDDDPSYDDAVRAGAEQPSGGAVRPTGSGPPRRSAASTMLPSDLLERLATELEKAERGAARTLDLPDQSPELPEAAQEPAPRPVLHREIPKRRPTSRGSAQRPTPKPLSPRRGTAVRRASPGAIERRPDHAIHLSHRGYGTDPSERAPSEQEGLDPLAEFLSADAKAARHQH